MSNHIMAELRQLRISSSSSRREESAAGPVVYTYCGTTRMIYSNVYSP
eukprot:COSAG05_NODE_760_length_7489_cov_1.989716_7_plen_48_part_00